MRVYPRTRGETGAGAEQGEKRTGSIPARAGKPACAVSERRALRVYPRTRGETGKTDHWGTAG